MNDTTDRKRTYRRSTLNLTAIVNHNNQTSDLSNNYFRSFNTNKFYIVENKFAVVHFAVKGNLFIVFEKSVEHF